MIPGQERGRHKSLPFIKVSREEATVKAGGGKLVDPLVVVVHDGESLLAYGAAEASVPLEVDPAVRLSLPGALSRVRV